MKKFAMAAQYTEITLDEMDKFLKRAFRALRPLQFFRRGEYQYDLHLGPHVGIRVMTSITRHDIGADVGSDAIRVQLISLKDNGPLERGKAPIVKRTQGWRNSLQDKIEDAMEKYEEREEFWESWASTRQRSGDPEQKIREEERLEAEREDGEGDGPKEPDLAPAPRPTPTPSADRGTITDKQLNYIGVLLRGLGHHEWQSLGLARATGSNYMMSRDELSRLDKNTASKVITLLLSAGRGNASYRRYAADLEFEVEV